MVFVQCSTVYICVLTCDFVYEMDINKCHYVADMIAERVTVG